MLNATMRIVVNTERWGRMDLTERTGEWAFESRAGVGYTDAHISIDAPEQNLWVLVDHNASDILEFWLGEERVWYGYLAGARLSGSRLQIPAEGLGMRLRDTELWRIFSDSEYGRWEPQSSVPNGFAADNNNRVYVEGMDGVTFADGDEVNVSYPESSAELGGAIVRVQARVVVVITSGAWIVEIRDDSATVVWSTAVDVDTTVDLTIANAAGLSLALKKNGAGTGQAYARLTQVVVRTIDPATNSDIVEEILGVQGVTSTVTASGLAVDRAIYQGRSPLAALQEMAELGDGTESWLVTVYEDAAAFGPWASDDDPVWRLERRDLVRWGLEWRRDAVINAVRAELPDGWRSAWVTDSASIVRWGRREKTLRVPQTTQDEAERLAAIYLDDHAWPIAGLNLEIGSRCRKPDGSLWPMWLIRAGDVVVLHDITPDTDQVIRIQEMRASPRGVQLIPYGDESRLEVMLAAQEAQLQKLQEETATPTVSSGSGGGSSSGGSSGGDMYKSVYDANNDGIVEQADDADTLDGADLADIQSEIDSDIATHAGDVDAHHTRYTDGEAVTAILAADGPGSGLDADTLDGAELADIQSEIDGDISTHAGDVDAHHTRYTDGEAVAAMGTKGDSNPLHHDRYTDTEAQSVADTQIATHAGDVDAHHSRYTDGEAVTAMGTKDDANPLHHDRYTDTEAQAVADTQIATHAGDVDAHHTRPTSATESAEGLVELATTAEVQAGTDTGRAVTPAGLRADIPATAAANRGARYSSDGDLVPPDTGLIILNGTTDNNIWRLGETVLDLDFTGTDYDTAAECEAIGLKLSNTVPTFPYQLQGIVSGSWSHSAGNGWRPSTSVNDQGPAMLIPLMRSSDWQLLVQLRTYSRTSSDSTYIWLGAVGPGLHLPFTVFNYSYSSQPYRARLYTNNGDDTFTVRYDGSIKYSNPSLLGLRFYNGVPGVYDDLANAWYDYNGPFGGYLGYPVSHLFLQAILRTGSNYHTLDVMTLSLKYLI